MSRTLVALAALFAPLSVATVGGGQTIIADMQRQVVDVHHWMTHTQFVNDFAIARLAPGPGSLLATLVGFQVGGVAGALVATLALFGPTAFLMIAITHMTSRHRDAPWQRALQAGLRPVAAGLILAAVYTLIHGLDGGWIAIATALVSTALVMRTRVNALLLIAAGAAWFALLRACGVL
ncbi:chromate transporter [Burkholderia plantarii]|uniref:chromate transporter n=1 Tax=Burkholderia plantarii TaxID=41899 RepID=UPI0018DB87E9|nr:chromate transporter [Burkholderia plantarii]MBI0331003.1 chromate transporter [Burkholderia plantarii]